MNHDNLIIKLFIYDNHLLSNYLKLIRNKNKYENIKSYLRSRYDDVFDSKILYKEVIYRIYRNIDKRPVCKTCGRLTKFNHAKKLCYNEHCSKECALNDKNVRDKQNNTKLIKYDSVNNDKKRKETCLEKYGVDNPAKCSTIKEKIKQTNIEKYGMSSPLQNSKVKQKTKETNLSKYNHECAQSSKIIKDKISIAHKTYWNKLSKTEKQKHIDKFKQNMLAIYGVENISELKKRYFQHKESSTIDWNNVIYKTKQTNLERYGLTSALQLDKAKANAKIVMQNKYGVDYPFQSQEIIKKGKTTSNRLYGPNWETVVEKMIDTKRKNHTFNTSKPEDESFVLLKERYPDTVTQYKDDRYPFACDFYIPSLDLFIECNYHWTHGEHPYNEHNKEDKHIVESWENKHTKYYDNAVQTWTVRDVNKRNVAKENKLKYIEFWNINELRQFVS